MHKILLITPQDKSFVLIALMYNNQRLEKN
jgi:hypothetical protein